MLKNIIEKIIFVFAIVTVAIITISNLLYTTNIANDVAEMVTITSKTAISLAVSLFIIMAILICTSLISKMNVKKRIKIIIFIVAIIVYVLVNIVWLKISIIEPVADQKEVNSIAIKLVNGKMEELKQSGYLEKNPQQIGTSYFIATIYKIFNSTNYQIIQGLNIFSNVISIIVLYLITKEFLKEYNTNKLMYFIVTLTFIPIILLTTFVYGDYTGLMFASMGIYCIMKYTKTHKLHFAVISSILIAISYIIKSNYLIFILACIIYLLLDFLKSKNWKKAVMILLFILISILPNTLIKSVVSNKLELDKNKSIPTSAYIYMGMNEGTRSNGWYNSTMDYAWNNIEDAATYYPARIKERVWEFIKSPIYTVKFYAIKIVSMWTEVKFGSIWYNLPFHANDYTEFVTLMNKKTVLNSIYEGKLNTILETYQNALVLLIFIGATLGIWKNRKNLNSNFILLLLIFLGGFFFHVLWEAKSRYILPYVFILIPISIVGITDIINSIMQHKWKGKNNDL